MKYSTFMPALAGAALLTAGIAAPSAADSVAEFY